MSRFFYYWILSDSIINQFPEFLVKVMFNG